MAVLAYTKKEFKNWIKGALALHFTKEGLTDFVSAEVDRHHQRLMQLVPAANILNKCACTINSLPQCTRNRSHGHLVPGPRQMCARGVCNILMDGICKDHRFRGPSWNNTDPQKWCTDAFEVTKCFMAPDEYSQKSSLVEIDLNGILSVVINNLSFQAHIHDNLNIEPNTCTKAREVARKVRHTSDHLLSESDLRDYIDDLINLLCDPACLLNDFSAQDAVRKLRMLKTNDLTIHENDITEALKDNIRDKFSDEQRDLLQKIEDHYLKLQADSVAEIDRIIAVTKTELEDENASKSTDKSTRNADPKKEYEQTKENKFEAKLKGTDKYGFWDVLTFKEFRLRLEFKAELVRFYIEKESMTPASPLVENHAVPLKELYVQPPMWASMKPNAFKQGKELAEKTPVSSYRELFFNDDNVPYKNIYLEADAGYGKTVFTQQVTMTWCQAHKPSKVMKDKFKKKDVDTLKRFDFLFLLHLRDFEGEKCNIYEFILKFVSQSLPNKEQFSEQFISRMLQTKTCLVILDGLDEWVHPETCTRTPGIPHNNYRENCTILTTTRPWKLCTIGLPPNLIDQHLVIAELDDKTSEELKSNAVKILMENSGTLQPDLTDFDRKVSSVKIGDINLIPYNLLQRVCIWFDGLSISKSKCEMYSNTIELTLQRGLSKKYFPTLPTGITERDVTVPECVRHNLLCHRYVNLLLKLGKLAFYALFQSKKEFSLMIESTTVLNFLTEQELEFCLKIGLLSQSKDRSKVSVKRYKLFFQHKSVQEFMAALYITSEWNNDTIKSTIFEICSSLSTILEMENLFVFVCGMNSKIYTCISGEFQKTAKRDGITDRHSTHMNSDDNDDMGTILSYQSMQVQCFQESVRNGNDNCPIPFLVQNIEICHKRLTEDSFTCLVKLIDCSLVHPASGNKTIGLNSLDLDELTMTHINLERLHAVISQTTTLTQLKLEFLHCSDHKGQYGDCNVTLNIHRLDELKMLHLKWVPCRELRVNPACLEKLEFRPPLVDKMTARASATLWQDLRAAPVLSSLTLWSMASCQEMIQTIPTLTQLQDLQLAWIDIGDVIPRFSPAMTKLERVVLHGVRMSSAAWIELFLSIGQLPRSITVKLSMITMTSHGWRELLLSVGSLPLSITVKLSDCKGPSRDEWQTIMNTIKSTPVLSLTTDLSSGWMGDASLTMKSVCRTVQAQHKQRVKVYETEELACKVQESAKLQHSVKIYEPEKMAYEFQESAKLQQSVEVYEPEKLAYEFQESEYSLMSSELLNEIVNQPVCRLRASITKLNIYFRSRNNQVPRHPFHMEMLEAFSSLLKLNTHLECVILNKMKMGDKELESVKLSKENIEEISKYKKGKTNIVQLCTETIGRQIHNGAQFDLKDFLIELNSNIQHTFADSIILKLVCFDLVKCNIEVKEAYPSMLGADTLPSLVCFLDRHSNLSTFRGFLLKKRIIGDFVNESSKLENSIEKESDEYKRVLKENFEDINVTHAKHSRHLLSKHSNIEAIGVSFVKMSENDAVQICPCIVIYCKFKSAVPYKEDLFPRTLSHPLKTIFFQTDIREGYFSLCPYFARGSKEWNRELAMGCSIGEKNMEIATTVGPFVDVIETRETCFLTVRHLFLPITRMDDQLAGLKVVQPANCDLPPVQHNQMPERECGEVIASVFSEDIDAALVKVAEERKPARGHFITVTREELRKAGLNQSQIPTFDNGDSLTAAGLHIVDDATRPILKIGSRTGLTTGQLCTIDGVVKLTNDPLGFDFGYNGISQPHYFRKQLLVRSFHNQPFCIPGDSGSAVFLLDSDLRLKCIGIVIGIFSDYQAVVTPIEHILDILGRKYGDRTLQLKKFTLNEMEFE